MKVIHYVLIIFPEPPEKLNLVKDDVDNEEEYFNVPEGCKYFKFIYNLYLTFTIS